MDIIPWESKAVSWEDWSRYVLENPSIPVNNLSTGQVVEFIQNQQEWVEAHKKDWWQMNLDIINGDWEDWPEKFWPKFNQPNSLAIDFIAIAVIQLTMCKWEVKEQLTSLKKAIFFSWEACDTVWRENPRIMRKLFELPGLVEIFKTDWEDWPGELDDDFFTLESLILAVGGITLHECRSIGRLD